MDEFAQSREDNDLFADDFEPANQPLVIEEEVGSGPHESIQGGPAEEVESTRPPVSPVSSGAGPATGSARGGAQRGRRERRGGGSRRGEQVASKGLSAPRFAPRSAQALGENESEGKDGHDAETALESTYKGPQAVRGDRSGTGGPAHKKLTEEELSEKMARMKVLNAQKSERFRLSEADSAAFARKERAMEKKRVEEQKNSRAMDMERAKNRERKLRAQGGREWDSEKQESDLVDGKTRGRSSQYFRGAHGTSGAGRVNGSATSTFNSGFVVLDTADRSPGHHRGSQRGRGRVRGAQRGRGGSELENAGPEDFPSLPASNNKVFDSEPKLAGPISKSDIEKSSTSVSGQQNGEQSISDDTPAAARTQGNALEKQSSATAQSNWAEEMALAEDGDKTVSA